MTATTNEKLQDKMVEEKMLEVKKANRILMIKGKKNEIKSGSINFSKEDILWKKKRYKG